MLLGGQEQTEVVAFGAVAGGVLPVEEDAIGGGAKLDGPASNRGRAARTFPASGDGTWVVSPTKKPRQGPASLRAQGDTQASTVSALHAAEKRYRRRQRRQSLTGRLEDWDHKGEQKLRRTRSQQDVRAVTQQLTFVDRSRVLSPDGLFCRQWDTLMCALIIMTAFVTPCVLCSPSRTPLTDSRSTRHPPSSYRLTDRRIEGSTNEPINQTQGWRSDQ